MYTLSIQCKINDKADYGDEFTWDLVSFDELSEEAQERAWKLHLDMREIEYPDKEDVHCLMLDFLECLQEAVILQDMSIDCDCPVFYVNPGMATTLGMRAWGWLHKRVYQSDPKAYILGQKSRLSKVLKRQKGKHEHWTDDLIIGVVQKFMYNKEYWTHDTTLEDAVTDIVKAIHAEFHGDYADLYSFDYFKENHDMYDGQGFYTKDGIHIEIGVCK